MIRERLLSWCAVALLAGCTSLTYDAADAGPASASDGHAADAGRSTGGRARDGGADGDTAGGKGSSATPPNGDGGDGGSSAGSGATSSCTPTGEQEFPHDSSAPGHVAEPLDPSAYNSRPPSSGEHCDTWGAFGEYSEQNPLPACNFIHNLEHGAIVLLYNCPSGCPDIVDGLRQVMADAPADPDCLTVPVKRLLLTPYADMDTRVAASAWGYTWTSDCLDADARDSLLSFITTHWGSRGDGPESMLCSPGSIQP